MGVAVSLGVPGALSDAVALLVNAAVPVRLSLNDGRLVLVGEPLGRAVLEPVPESVGVTVAVDVSDDVPEDVAVALKDDVPVGGGDALLEAVSEAVPDGVAPEVSDDVAVALLLDVGVSDTDELEVALLVGFAEEEEETEERADRDGVYEGFGVLVPVALRVADALPVLVDEPLRVPVRVALDEPVPVALDVRVPVALDEPVPVALGEPVPVAVGEPVLLQLEEPVLVAVCDGESAAVRVIVGGLMHTVTASTSSSDDAEPSGVLRTRNWSVWVPGSASVCSRCSHADEAYAPYC